MKTNKIITALVAGMAMTSCLSENYRVITAVNRDGSSRREMQTLTDSTFRIANNFFPYDLASGWEITQSDTVVDDGNISRKTQKNVTISKRFHSVEEMSASLSPDKVFPAAEESLDKCFRWFYTYYVFTAVYPEITEKGRVPMDKYLNEAERKLYFRGDVSDYHGMSGMELKEELDGMETRFMEWYARSVYEECFDVICSYAGMAGIALQPQLSAVKDTLYSVNKKQLDCASIKAVCDMLDNFYATDRFSGLYAGNEREMDDLLKKKEEIVDALLKFNIQYELSLPGKVMAANTDLRNKDALLWKVDAFRFLADDYVLTAESRTVNVWAFAVTILIVLVAIYCLWKGGAVE